MDFQCALHKPSTLLDHLDNCPHLRSLTQNCTMLDLDLFLRCLRCLPSSRIYRSLALTSDMHLALSVVHTLKRDSAVPSSIALLSRLTTLMLASEHKSSIAFRRAFVTAVRSRIILMTVGIEQLSCLTACYSITPGASAVGGRVDTTLERVQERLWPWGPRSGPSQSTSPREGGMASRI
ncbi:uncharacterized protein SCHCODRAFT_02199557 [Schizophyllum commune H4-8]|uniref:uncharacterized protein n=1 Tax=Schizophyllum commune (strain H4-8 / FGSC 9210) TaxID=578458 RepID=UPI00216094DF|nr:uncharacterized protein SCHCODRAFT_02199557 [Schizophyllum commune H4-8]KAI5896823.1 hypothetical protein SCHCODRAFT_02199557 [Schizophyllum commune H4-8]